MKIDGGGAVGANAEIERVTERELARKPHEDVPSLAGVREEQKQSRHREKIRAGNARQNQQQGGQRG
jgi:hypothetical protein